MRCGTWLLIPADRKRKPPRLRGGLGLVDDLLEDVDQVIEIGEGDVTGEDLVFQIDGQRLKLGLRAGLT